MVWGREGGVESRAGRWRGDRRRKRRQELGRGKWKSRARLGAERAGSKAGQGVGAAPSVATRRGPGRGHAGEKAGSGLGPGSGQMRAEAWGPGMGSKMPGSGLGN